MRFRGRLDKLSAKTKTFQVTNSRVFFRCPSCGAKRNMAIAPGVRQKSIVCHKCEEAVRCRFNRRSRNRATQSGKVMLVGSSGKVLEINLSDISPTGVGFDIHIRDARAHLLTVGEEIQFRCSWNPRLFGNSRYVVKNIKGQRIGAEKTSIGGWG